MKKKSVIKKTVVPVVESTGMEVLNDIRTLIELPVAGWQHTRMLK